jgi:hypothetical protein
MRSVFSGAVRRPEPPIHGVHHRLDIRSQETLHLGECGIVVTGEVAGVTPPSCEVRQGDHQRTHSAEIGNLDRLESADTTVSTWIAHAGAPSALAGAQPGSTRFAVAFREDEDVLGRSHAVGSGDKRGPRRSITSGEWAGGRRFTAPPPIQETRSGESAPLCRWANSGIWSCR